MIVLVIRQEAKLSFMPEILVPNIAVDASLDEKMLPGVGLVGNPGATFHCFFSCTVVVKTFCA